MLRQRGWMIAGMIVLAIQVKTRCGASDAESRVSGRPNVLLIITDDQNNYAFDGSGVDVRTPYLDRFRTQAITFPKAYCASPVCGPSRASLFSGLYPHHTGAYLNGADPWRRSERLQLVETLPEAMRRGGYETWGMGKLYHAPLPESRADTQWDNQARANGGFGPFPDEDHQLSGKFFSVKEWDGPDEDFPDVRSANAAIDFLRQRESKNADPFFMVYGLWRPHNPWTAPRRFFDAYDPGNMVFPPIGHFADDLDDVPTEGHQLAAIFGQRWEKHGRNNPASWRRVMHGYLACTSFADWNVGRVIEALDATGLGENTIVIVTSDNGYHVGEKNHYGKSTLWEQSARVPLMIRLPGQLHAGSVSKAAVGLLDLYPTLVSQCDVEKPRQELDGRDLSPVLSDPTTAWDHPVITTYGEGRFSLRQGPWRYIQYPDGTEEIYDHRSDPFERQNLATDESTRLVRQRFRAEVPKRWEKSVGGRNG